MKYITVNIDDLGMHPAVNEAVCRLGEQGIAQSASLMSLGTVSQEHWRSLQQSGIEIGLHLDFTGFAKQGSLKTVLLKSWLRRWNKNDLRNLICRQLDNFEQQSGQVPVFVDGHQHVHQFPQIREVLLEELRLRYVKCPYLRSTRPFSVSAKGQLIYMLGGAYFRRVLKHSGFQANAYFGGVYSFDDDMQTLSQRWQQWLVQAPERGTVLMCHPAVPYDGVYDDIQLAREMEWRWFCSAEYHDLLQQYEVQAQSWRDAVVL